MIRLPAFQRSALLEGAFAGVVLVALTWAGTETVLRLATSFPPLTLGQYGRYLQDSVLPGAVLGAGTGQSWQWSRQDYRQAARTLCFATGFIVMLAYVGAALWRAIGGSPMQIGLGSGSNVAWFSLPRWAFEIFNLFTSKNLPLLLSILLIVVGITWTARGAEQGRDGKTEERGGGTL